MHQGKVKKFLDDVGYGFIIADDGSVGELFFHRTELRNASSVDPGARVEFEIIPSPNKTGTFRARQVKVLV